MSPKKEQIVSAQVVLIPASGRSVTRGDAAITAANIHEYMPAEDTFTEAASRFQEAGFEVSAAGPTGFSISAPSKTFEKFFDTRLSHEESGAVKALHKDKSESFELPLRALPREISRHVEAVTFTPPPDFGPGNY